MQLEFEPRERAERRQEEAIDVAGGLTTVVAHRRSLHACIRGDSPPLDRDRARSADVELVPMPAGGVTRLLRAWSEGDEAALDQLIPIVEAELRRLARGYMARERPGHTLQVTALVNEAFLRLTDARRVQWQDRAHFLGISARLMRRVLVDHARSRGYKKRGGGRQQVTLDDALLVTPGPAVDLIALDRALTALADVDARKCRVVELRYFAGLSVEETADTLHVSADTVKRDWRLARLWLLRAIEGGAP